MPESWPALRRHLHRVLRDDPALSARLAAARVQWIEYHATRDQLANADWYIAAEAAEEEAAAAIEMLHQRIAQAPAQGWSGLRVKLQVLWDLTGRRSSNIDRSEWDVSDQIIWSALQDMRLPACAAENS